MKFKLSWLSITAIAIVTACTSDARVATVKTGLDVATCVTQNLGKPPLEVVAKCIRDGVTEDDIKRILATQELAINAAVERRLTAQRGGSLPSDAGTLEAGTKDAGSR